MTFGTFFVPAKSAQQLNITMLLFFPLYFSWGTSLTVPTVPVASRILAVYSVPGSDSRPLTTLWCIERTARSQIIIHKTRFKRGWTINVHTVFWQNLSMFSINCNRKTSGSRGRTIITSTFDHLLREGCEPISNRCSVRKYENRQSSTSKQIISLPRRFSWNTK